MRNCFPSTERTEDNLSLKWGTLKAWKLTSPRGLELLRQYYELGSMPGAMQQRDTPEHKVLICQMIDECGADKIHLDWDNKYVSKAKAKEYVMEYGTNPPATHSPTPKEGA